MAAPLALAMACGSTGEIPFETVDAGMFEDARELPDAVSPDAGAPDAGSDEDAGAPDAGSPVPEGPYPIVLSHGFFGFESLGVGEWDITDYFYGVPEHLASLGETEVFTPAVDPFNDSTHRGEELLAQVERILEETGAAKVNLIGHSQGGLDVRYVASVRPDLVASVTSIATPHLGTPMLDLVDAATANPSLRRPLNDLLRLIGGVLWSEIDEDSDIFQSFESLSASGAAEFNERHPDQPGVAYYSLTGRSDYHLGADLCDPQGGPSPAFIARWADERDPIDPLFAVAEAMFDGGFGDPEPNDGLVRVSSARWGRFLGCIPADHLDQVGQLFGDEPGTFNEWDHLEFYGELVDWLRLQGH